MPERSVISNAGEKMMMMLYGLIQRNDTRDDMHIRIFKIKESSRFANLGKICQAMSGVRKNQEQQENRKIYAPGIMLSSKI